jgi:hypothetical protein
MLTSISTTKIVDLGIKGFHLMREISLRCFCALKLPKKIRNELEKSFGFRVGFGFLCGLFYFILFCFLRSFMSLSRSLGFF